MFSSGVSRDFSVFGNGIYTYRLKEEGMDIGEKAAEVAKESLRIQGIWEKAYIVPGYNPRVWRIDQCRTWIKRDEYGNRQSPYGWEMDHIIPKSKGGSDHLFNLRPLQWYNNARRQAGYLTC
ncbi:MAG: HNH endonuclease signature motif containing protein [Coleofasciculus sp. G1-WW12-02]|uniref:HNH endonuclease signature motif containing protein n=1 Tax=Coleofasciculus sp. G1-WW12-02 TaxID=3068483 RepID=UPI0032FCFD05